MIQYNIHNLIDVCVDSRCTDAMRDTIAFQLAHFQCNTSGAEVLIDVRPYGDWIATRPNAAQAFHLYHGDAGMWLDDPDKRVAYTRCDSGYIVYADTPAFLVNMLIQFALVERGISLIHAAAIADPDGNVTLLPGPGGVGKTAVLGAMVRDHGWKLLGDDIVGLSRDGECYAFPRSFVLKPYHESVYPELFTELGIRSEDRLHKNKTSILHTFANLFVDNMPFKGLARTLLRKTGHLGAVQQSLAEPRGESYLATPSVERVFGEGCVQMRGPVRDMLFLERWAGNDFENTTMTFDAMAGRLFAIIHHEWVGHMRHFWSLGALDLVDLSAYFSNVNNIIQQGMANPSLHRLRIPHGATPEALTEHFLSHVKQRAIRKEAA